MMEFVAFIVTGSDYTRHEGYLESSPRGAKLAAKASRRVKMPYLLGCIGTPTARGRGGATRVGDGVRLSRG